METRGIAYFIVNGIISDLKEFLNSDKLRMNGNLTNLTNLHNELVYIICTNDFQYVQMSENEYIIVLNDENELNQDALKISIKKA